MLDRNSKASDVLAPPKRVRRTRRHFSVEEKSRILREADACTKRGQLAELLLREGIYSSHLSMWRAQRTREGLVGLQSKRPGPKPRRDARDKLIERLRKRIQKLAQELRMLKALARLQQHAHDVLETTRPSSGVPRDAH